MEARNAHGRLHVDAAKAARACVRTIKPTNGAGRLNPPRTTPTTNTEVWPAFMATQRAEKGVKTNKIMTRFRPIAPRPVLAPPPGCAANAVLSLQSRPRKRGKRVSPRHASPEPVERDLLSKLQEPKVMMPRPARPVRTTICVDISSVTGANSAELAVCRMTPEQLERDALPAVISGPSNRVRRVNEAYKALVGQPVCPWLDYLQPGGAGASRRISGEVVLDVRRFTSTQPPNRAGAGGNFSCGSRITWERDGALASVAAPCDVMRLEDCSSGDCLFIWRFDITRASVFYCLP